MLHARREEPVADDRDKCLERRRAAVIAKAGRRLVDPHRLLHRSRRERGGRRRHQVGQDAVGHRRDPDREVAQVRDQRRRFLLRPCEPRGRVRRASRLHRERRVEDEEHLGVEAFRGRLRVDDDRLGGGDRDEGGEERERDTRRHELAPAGRGEREDPAQPERSPPHQDERRERDRGSEREQAGERSEERDADQNPPPRTPAPCDPPGPNPPRASAPNFVFAGRTSRSSSSRLAFAV